MPLDVLGYTRVTLIYSTSIIIPYSMELGNLLNIYRDGDRPL